MFLRQLQKYFLLILCLITFCAFPALAMAAQSRLPEDSSRFAAQRYVSVGDQKWMENIVGVSKNENASLDLIKTNITEKQSLISERDSAKSSWIITPLFDGYTNSSLSAHILPIGVILKLKFQ